MRPYIGITDFTSVHQVRALHKVFLRCRPLHGTHMLHVGVMMSYKTLNDLETKWATAYPAKGAIQRIFSTYDAPGDLYHCLHYADYDGRTTPSDLRRAIRYAGHELHAVQLDMPWPEPSLLRHSLWPDPHLEVILQVGARAIEEANNEPAAVVTRLEEYQGIVHRVLLDKSMGRGLGMDAAALLPFARAIKERFPDLGLVVAGGLGPHTLHLADPLRTEFPDISIDAQGRLRPSGSALDPINWDMAEEYLTKALMPIGMVDAVPTI